MRVHRVRLIAWGFALLLLAVLLLRGRRHQSADDIGALPAAPGLLQVHGDVEPISVPERGQETQAGMRFRETAATTADAIQEPAAESTQPSSDAPQLADEYAPLPKYQVPNTEDTEELTRLPPAELLLTEPKREEAELAPRAAQEVRTPVAEPVFESPPPAPLPMIGRNNPAMEPVNNMAREHVRRGFSLGERSAVYAARNEFIQALRTITQAVDAQAGLGPKDPQSCSQALVRGLGALTEADDLAPSGSRLDGELDIVSILNAHRTPVCKGQTNIAQLAALQAYFDYSRQELTRAAASNPVASQALTGLGKTYTVTSEKNQRLASAKAMVFHQAAVAADPRNHLAANELGVLLARFEQWEAAKQSFLTGLRVQRDAATWQNLASVHARLGEHDLARLAEQERVLLTGGKLNNVVSAVDGRPTVQWVDPQAFAGPPEEAQSHPLPVAAQAQPAGIRPAAKSQAAKSDSWSWLPWR